MAFEKSPHHEYRALYLHPAPQTDASGVRKVLIEAGEFVAAVFGENRPARTWAYDLRKKIDGALSALQPDESADLTVAHAVGEDGPAQTPPEGAVTEAQGWRSIETAPKDGSIIILTNGREVFAGAWEARIKGDGFPWLLVEDVSTHQPHGCCDMEDDERIEVNGWPATAPTHWMPLPTPPVNQSEGADR